MSNSFDTTENNRNNDAEIAKIFALGTDREQTQQLVQDYGDNAYLFNATAATFNNGTGGIAVFMQSETWPALDYRNAGIGAVVTLLGPCGINQMHTHQQSELQFNIGPGVIRSYFIENNGLPIVNNTKLPGSATLFPRNSIHMEMNTECVPTTFLSYFPSPDFERVDMAQIVNFGSSILNATFAGYGSENLVPSAVSQGAVLRGTADCLQRCGLPDDYEFAALYPNLNYFTQEWFNPNLFYSSLSIPGANATTVSDPAPVPSNSSTPLTRRQLDDTVMMKDPLSGSLSHGYLTLGENPLQPVVFGLTLTTLGLIVAILLSVFGFIRRKQYKDEGEY